jgi:membrane protease YdiL (CAAX protease family)
MKNQGSSIAKILVALALGYGCALAWVAYADIVYHNHVPLQAFEFHGLYPISLGLSAILATLLFDRSLKSIGFTRFDSKYLLISISLALVILVVPFGLNLITGFANLNPAPKFDMELMKVGIPVLVILAMGEEIMWRGLLYAEFSKKYSFIATSFIIAMLWIVWHLPVIIHTRFIYADRPMWFALIAFPINIIASSFYYNYLRMKSNSIWPCVFLHAFTNYFAFLFIEPLEMRTNLSSVFFINDIGVYYVAINVAIALFVLKKVIANK